jgi:hypothetical protein
MIIDSNYDKLVKKVNKEITNNFTINRILNIYNDWHQKDIETKKIEKLTKSECLRIINLVVSSIIKLYEESLIQNKDKYREPFIISFYIENTIGEIIYSPISCYPIKNWKSFINVVNKDIRVVSKENYFYTAYNGFRHIYLLVDMSDVEKTISILKEEDEYDSFLLSCLNGMEYNGANIIIDKNTPVNIITNIYDNYMNELNMPIKRRIINEFHN